MGEGVFTRPVIGYQLSVEIRDKEQGGGQGREEGIVGQIDKVLIPNTQYPIQESLIQESPICSDRGHNKLLRKKRSRSSFMWCVAVVNKIKQIYLRQLLIPALAAIATVALSEPVRGQTADEIEGLAEIAVQEEIIVESEPESSSLLAQETETVVDVRETDESNSNSATVVIETTTEATETFPLPKIHEEVEGEPETNQAEIANPESLVSLESITPDSESTESTVAQDQPPAQEPRVLVAEVLVRGVEGELEQLVYNTISTQPGRATTRSQLQQDVNEIFATGYFSNVTVVPEDTPLGVRITYQVEPNPILRDVVIQTIPQGEGERVLPESVVDEIFGEQYGDILNLVELQGDIQELNEWYRENGYDLAQVVDAPDEPGEISQDGVVTLVVAEGVIENVRVRFFDEEDEEVDGRTRDFIVTREIELESGEVFNRETAQRDLQRVFGLGLFEDARLSFAPGDDPSQVVVNVDVVERNTGSVAAGAGISSASGFFGTISYQEQNLGGNNQDLSAELQVGTRELLFDLRFTDPWIAGDPYRTSYTVNAFRRRSISLIFDGGEEEVELPNGDRPRVVRTGGGITFRRPLADDVFSQPEWALSTGFQYQRVSIRDADGELAPEDELGNDLAFSDDGSDDLFILSFGAVRDRRNSIFQPTDGSVIRFSVDQTIPIGSGSIFFNRLRGSYSYYIPVDYTDFAEGAEALAFNFQAGTILGDLPPYEAFSLGGTDSVRGYDAGDVGSGRSYVLASAEYRFPLFSFLGGALFVDFGSDLGTGDNVPGNPAGVRDKPGTGFGYGVGVRIQSPLGPIRVDYGLNDNGDSRLHFGIGERF
uniref:BamA/TamA family outer membrane protein n=1 Tax=Oscillatoria salina TaxID=331517 RepID=UPI002961F8BE|nr:BamA/TamA family outer membrane protein [Oscillatoria salina]